MQSPPWQLARLFTPAEVTAAFAALADPALFHFAAQPLAPYWSHRGTRSSAACKQHLDIPLKALAPGSAVLQAIPSAILHIYRGLFDRAMAYTEDALKHPSVSAEVRTGVLHDVERKSVLRLLRYELGVGCRPHVDPGLCTCLLLGSEGGLEVNLQASGRKGLAVRGLLGNYRYDTEDGKGDAEGANRLDKLPGWHNPVTGSAGGPCAQQSDVLIMTGNMLEVVSRGALPGVLHRVRYDWAAAAGGKVGQQGAGPVAADPAAPPAVRSNIVVELRPANPKRLYKAL